jgi:hypothetical protein
MALTSPGVEVTVIDESFYTPAEPGSVPLVIVATAENKLNGAGTAVAAGTLTANAGKVYRITSQRELVETFGIPFFEKTATANPIHGGERNEYGLLAAYSLLGVTNSAFIMRANVDLNELASDTSEPGAEPRNGTWWVNSNASSWGIQEWNSNLASVTGGQKFASKIPIVLTDNDSAKLSSNTPKDSVGNIGDYCVVFKTVQGDGSFESSDEFARIFYKSPGNTVVGIDPGTWVLVGSPDWAQSWPSAFSTEAVSTLTTSDQFSINGTTITVPSGSSVSARLTALKDAINGAGIQGISASESRGRLYIYSDGATEQASDSKLSGAVVITNVTNTPLINLKITAGTYLAPKIEHAPHTQRPLYKRSEQFGTILGYPSGSVWLKTTEPNQGARLRVSRWNSSTSTWVPYEAPIYRNGQDAIYSLDRSGGGQNIETDTLFTQFNATENYSYRSPDNSPETEPNQIGGYDASLETAEFRIWRRRSKGATVIASSIIDTGTFTPGAKSIIIKQSITGSASLSAATTVVFSTTGGASDADTIAAAINAASFADENNEEITNNVVASVSDDNRLIISHKTGGEIRFKNGTGTVLSSLFTPFNLANGTGTINFYDLNSGGTSLVTGTDDNYLASNWIPLAASISPSYFVSANEPLNEPEDGQLWYNPSFGQVDIMIHNGNTWVGYHNFNSAYANCSPNGAIVSATAPDAATGQSDGTPLVDGDLWISTADLENFPTIYRWNGDSSEWILIDKTDQTTEDGIVFADARYGLDGASGNTAAPIRDLLTSNYLDPDAPDPALYPKGIMLYNTRRSYGNVKRYANNYINTAEDNVRFDSTNSPIGDTWQSGESMSSYATDRWVTASPNNEDGSGSFGRKAQRALVVQRIKSVTDTSEEARDEERRNFNLIAAPGYPELLSNLINLNLDRKLTAFVIGDTPLRLKSDATTLTNWGTNARLVLDNGDDGIVSFDEYCAVYYPNGFTTDLGGANAVVPASHMMLRTVILSDQVSYPWFAPAGTRRGGITNATAVGYIDAATGEFQTVALNTGQRDTLYELKVNPIPFFVGVGLVAYGQKTRARNASALDRINVARLVVYLRSQLNKLARPYIFEPNDQITRDEIKAAAESLLLELVALRAIYDFAVVCDESNNTPSRVDRNELYLDIAIEPTKAVEFIYIPLRLKNTGEI